MKVFQFDILGPKIIFPEIFRDSRGTFHETWQLERYCTEGITDHFVQDSMSFSTFGVRKGLHFQNPHAQAKLISVIRGRIFDVAVDIKKNSPTFGRWVSVILDDETFNQFYIPKGFAHGYCVLSEEALILYKLSDYYTPSAEKGISCDDPDIGIEWPKMQFITIPRDLDFPLLKEVPINFLPNLPFFS